MAHVGDVGEHGEAPHVFVWNIDFLTVNGQIDTAEEAKVETRGCDDDVGVQLLARVQQNAVADDGLDGVCDDRRVPAVEALEEVAVRAQAKALFPGIVARLKVWVDGEVRG